MKYEYKLPSKTKPENKPKMGMSFGSVELKDKNLADQIRWQIFNNPLMSTSL